MRQVNQETYFVLDDNELDKLVEKELGIKNYSCVAEGEWHNDSQHCISAGADLMAWHESWDREKVLERIATSPRQLPDVLPVYVVRELVYRQILPPGDYLIKVSW